MELHSSSDKPILDPAVERAIRQAVVEAMKSPSAGSGKLLHPKEAAELLGIKEQTLAVWRTRGIGPAFVKIGSNVRYEMAAIKDYINSNRVIH